MRLDRMAHTSEAGTSMQACQRYLTLSISANVRLSVWLQEYSQSRAIVLQDMDPHEVSLEQANSLLAAKSANPRVSPRKKLIAKAAKKPVSKKKPTTPKAEAAPRPLTGYQYFCKQRRAELRQSSSTLKPTEVMQLLGREWQQLSEQEKEAFKDQSLAHVSQEHCDEPVSKKKPTTPKAEAAPRPLTGYQYFCKQRRAELRQSSSTLKPTEVMQLLGREWQQLSEQEKEAFKDQSLAHVSQEHCDEPVSKNKLTTPKADAAPRPLTGYQFFCKQRRAELRQSSNALKPREVMQLLGREWQQLSEQEKEAFRDQSLAHVSQEHCDEHSL